MASLIRILKSVLLIQEAELKELCNSIEVFELSQDHEIVDLHFENENFVRSDDKYYVLVLVNIKPLKMEIDSGAKFSLIPEDI
ncbi:hypothetical protein HHI36_000301 [Cryptolaemus montrouzieri]|uniref:Peptidase A2 domain-containing protein n=1 Tax=Cryptolaemus montrouzieri TaxID=559131 RepID=A0ABD2P4X8_9CUCU